jgi:hypothetical protein
VVKLPVRTTTTSQRRRWSVMLIGGATNGLRRRATLIYLSGTHRWAVHVLHAGRHRPGCAGCRPSAWPVSGCGQLLGDERRSGQTVPPAPSAHDDSAQSTAPTVLQVSRRWSQLPSVSPNPGPADNVSDWLEDRPGQARIGAWLTSATSRCAVAAHQSGRPLLRPTRGAPHPS